MENLQISEDIEYIRWHWLMTSATTVPLHSLLKDFPNLFMPGLSLSLHPNPLKMFDINQVKIPSPE